MKSRSLLRKLGRPGALLLSIYLTWGHLGAAWAVDSADVMPAHIRSLSLKAGTVMGLNELYTNSGELSYLSTVNSVELDVKTLTQLDARVQQLQTALNQFGTFNVGDQLHLGQLTVDADPSVSYFAPLFLYGYSKKLTLGLAVPVITYQNNVGVAHVGSNVPQLRAEFGGRSPELDTAFTELSRDMRSVFHQTLSEKGYEPLKDVDEQFIGDVQLVSAYQFRKLRDWTYTGQFHVGLPTGPKPDADSLTDLETFGRWTLRPTWISQYQQDKKNIWVGSIAYQAILPMEVEKRVPKASYDTLPAADQKMDLDWDVGDSWMLGLARAHKFDDTYSAAVGYSFEQKWRDQYAGAPGGRENFLERGTERLAHVGKLEFTYSSISDFMKKKAMIPGTVVYEMSKVFAGQNMENQFKHEVWLSVYF